MHVRWQHININVHDHTQRHILCDSQERDREHAARVRKVNRGTDRRPFFEVQSFSQCKRDLTICFVAAAENDRNPTMNCLQNLSMSVLKWNHHLLFDSCLVWNNFIQIYAYDFLSQIIFFAAAKLQMPAEKAWVPALQTGTLVRATFCICSLCIQPLCYFYRMLKWLFCFIQVMRNFTDLHRRSSVKVASDLEVIMRFCIRLFYCDWFVSFVLMLISFKQFSDWIFSSVWGITSLWMCVCARARAYAYAYIIFQFRKCINSYSK